MVKQCAVKQGAVKYGRSNLSGHQNEGQTRRAGRIIILLYNDVLEYYNIHNFIKCKDGITQEGGPTVPHTTKRYNITKSLSNIIFNRITLQKI